jgi:hypothetical protein
VASKAAQIKALRELVLEGIALYNPTPVKGQKGRTNTAAGIIAVHLFSQGVRALLLLWWLIPL